MTYYIYHIPGKKIGMTCDLYNRVTEQQGYDPHEYEVLTESQDIGFASDIERQLQKDGPGPRSDYNCRQIAVIPSS